MEVGVGRGDRPWVLETSRSSQVTKIGKIRFNVGLTF